MELLSATPVVPHRRALGNLQDVGRLGGQLDRLWAALGQFVQCAIKLPVGVVQFCLHCDEASLQNITLIRPPSGDVFQARFDT